MNSLYTDDVARLFLTLKLEFRSFGVRALIAEEEFNLNLVFFRDNFSSLDGVDQERVAMLVKEFMEKVRGMGIPIYMQVAKGDGRGAGA